MQAVPFVCTGASYELRLYAVVQEVLAYLRLLRCGCAEDALTGLAATSALQLCQVPVCCAGFIICSILCRTLACPAPGEVLSASGALRLQLHQMPRLRATVWADWCPLPDKPAWVRDDRLDVRPVFARHWLRATPQESRETTRQNATEQTGTLNSHRTTDSRERTFAPLEWLISFKVDAHVK
jgi:hypothetical protein